MPIAHSLVVDHAARSRLAFPLDTNRILIERASPSLATVVYQSIGTGSDSDKSFLPQMRTYAANQIFTCAELSSSMPSQSSSCTTSPTGIEANLRRARARTGGVSGIDFPVAAWCRRLRCSIPSAHPAVPWLPIAPSWLPQSPIVNTLPGCERGATQRPKVFTSAWNTQHAAADSPIRSVSLTEPFRYVDSLGVFGCILSRLIDSLRFRAGRACSHLCVGRFGSLC